MSNDCFRVDDWIFVNLVSSSTSTLICVFHHQIYSKRFIFPLICFIGRKCSNRRPWFAKKCRVRRGIDWVSKFFSRSDITFSMLHKLFDTIIRPLDNMEQIHAVTLKWNDFFQEIFLRTGNFLLIWMSLMKIEKDKISADENWKSLIVVQ